MCVFFFCGGEGLFFYLLNVVCWSFIFSAAAYSVMWVTVPFPPVGALMSVAWMTTVSIGVLVARFFRSVWSKAFFFGEAAWFQVSNEKGLKPFPCYSNTVTWGLSVCVCTCSRSCVHIDVWACVCEDYLWESVFFHRMGSGIAQVTRLHSKSIYLLSHLAGPRVFFFSQL